MQPLISIIIPVWNVDQFLEKCLDSVLGQTYQNLQVILIDDGSPDACGRICDIYAEKDARIEVIHQENAGVCHARNEGMKLVRGEYIGFVDPDDWIAPDMFEYLLNGIKEQRAQIACCRYYRVTDAEEIYSQCNGMTQVYSSKEAVEELVKHRFILRNVFWNKLFKAELFSGIEFPVGRIYEGTAMIYKLLQKAEKVVLLGDPKYYYVDNPSSYINQRSIKYLADFSIAHINRYRDLEMEFPEIRVKLMQDFIMEVLKYRYLSGVPQSELEKYREDLNIIRTFIEENKTFIYKEIGLKEYEQKILSNVILFSERGLKKARKIGAFYVRKEKLLTILKRGKERVKEVPTQIAYEKTYFNQINHEILRKLQRYELEILKEVARICEENDIQYYIYGGTLLGAVRHSGFIPWDDDIDIVMPRKDYLRFLDIAKDKLGDKYFCQTCFNDKEYPMLFAKVRRENSYIVEEKWEKKRMHAGIYIDILPLYGIPDNLFLEKCFLHLFSVVHQACSFDKPITNRKITKFVFGILKKFPIETLYRLRQAILNLSDKFAGKKYVCSYGSHYKPMIRRVMKKEWFTGADKMKFEDAYFCVPNGWKEYLIHLYGENYMELPPEEKRETHLNLTKTVFPKEG